MLVKEGMATCGICGRQFELKADDRYISRDSGKTGLFAGLSTQNEEQLYDTFDCPHCGCQNVAQKRNRMWIPEPIEQDDEEEQPTGSVTVVMADEVGPAPTAEQIAKLTKGVTEVDPDPGSPACEGTGPWCQVPCPGIENCPECQPRTEVAEAEVKGHWTCEGHGRWCAEDCPGPDKCEHRDPGPVFHPEAEEPDCMGYYQRYIQKCYWCFYKKRCADKAGVEIEEAENADN